MIKNRKKAFSLFEVIISLVIASIIAVASLNYLSDLVKLNKNDMANEIRNLDIKSTKIFLQKNSKNINANLIFNDNKLYFKNSILLDDVSNFSSVENEKYFQIDFDFNNKKYQWIIKK